MRRTRQARIEDAIETDGLFTVLMGDQVEPRRKFIEDNALDVKNSTRKIFLAQRHRGHKEKSIPFVSFVSFVSLW